MAATLERANRVCKMFVIASVAWQSIFKSHHKHRLPRYARNDGGDYNNLGN